MSKGFKFTKMVSSSNYTLITVPLNHIASEQSLMAESRQCLPVSLFVFSCWRDVGRNIAMTLSLKI